MSEHGATPQGVRQDVVTYTVRDRSGMVRNSGMKDLEGASRHAQTLVEQAEVGPFMVERVTYVSFTHRETIETFGEEPTDA